MNNKELITLYKETAAKKPFNISSGSIDIYILNIMYVLEYLEDKNILEITHKDLKRYFLSVNDIASSTYNQRINSLKSLYKVLKYHPETEDLIDVDPTYGLVTIKAEISKKTPLNAEEQMNLIRGCKNKRDRAIMFTLLTTGLRIHELIALTYEQYLNRGSDGSIYLTVNKGSFNDETIFINPETENAIEEYLKVRHPGCERLFVSNSGTPMERISLSRTFKNIARKTGKFDEARISQISNHLMRHTFGTNLVNNDVPIDVVAKALRHHSLGTVMTYAKTDVSRVGNAVMNQ